MNSILIIRLSAIGDVIHTLPALAALRRALPRARIGWVVEDLSAPLLEGHPQIDRLYVIPKRRWRGQWSRVWRSEVVPFFRAIRADGWDAAIDFQGLTKSGLAAWASGAPVRVGFRGKDSREINCLFVNRRIYPPEEARHVVERNLALLAGVDVEPPREPVYGKIHVREDEIGWARGVIADWGAEWAAAWRPPTRESEGGGQENGSGLEGRGGIALLNPGAGWPTKRWPPWHFVELGARLHAAAGLRSVVVWGPREEPLRDAIRGGLQERAVPVQAAPPTSLRQLAALCLGAALFVSGDTGPAHLAAMMGIPTLALFGASDGRRNSPWGPRVATLQLDSLPCIPCWDTQCRLAKPSEQCVGHPDATSPPQPLPPPCLAQLDPERAAREALRLLGIKANYTNFP